jgi:hypothetical protein
VRQVAADHNSEAVLEMAAAVISRVTGTACPAEALDVARGLVRFTMDLPHWTRRTLGLSEKSSGVRRIFLQADDPHRALFAELPALFDNAGSKAIAAGLETAMRELSEAYPSMLADLRASMLGALGDSQNGTLDEIHRRAHTVANLTGDLRLDAFASRLATFAGSVEEIESLGSLAINKPPREWTDRDPDQARLALADLALGFRRAEMLARVKGRRPEREAIALIVGTGESGQAIVEEFEVADGDRDRIASLSVSLREILTRSGVDKNVALGALAETSLLTIRALDTVE